MAMWDRFHYGVCYYPEHWDRSLWESDLARMAACGFSVVRMGESAWGYWEPEEGKYQFSLFDEAIELCRKHDLHVILGTPTYAGPAWIVQKYPEVLRWDFQRRPVMHGGRRHFNYTSRKYIDLSDRICTALAEHYRNDKQVIGWQVDNEFNCHMDVSYAPSDSAAFRVWLREKYKTLAALNRAWGTVFWSQQYDDWEQVDLPGPVVAMHNPTQLLDESRFISDRVVRFARRQVGILRKANSTWKITHNGLFGNVKGPDLAAELDFISHDQYPLFQGEGEWTGTMQGLMQARSLSFPYAILEQQSGPGGQMDYFQRSPRPGQIRVWAWQSVAHGAKVLEYFRWRTIPFGAEMHWHGILDQDNKDNRRVAEVKQVGHEVFKVPEEFFDAPPPKAVAVLRDYDNETNERRINSYTRDGAWEYSRWTAEFAKRHIPVDMVWTGGDLRGYKVVVAPHLKMANAKLVEQLTKFVKAGGMLVLTAQAGTKDENLHIVNVTAPGVFRELAGVEIADWTALGKGEAREAVTMTGVRFELNAFVERVAPRGAEILAHWTDLPGAASAGVDTLLHTSPAVTVNTYGKGRVFYVGGYCTSQACGAMIAEMVERVNLPVLCQASERVEAVGRGDDGAEGCAWLVLMNHTPRPEPVRGLPAKAADLITGKAVAGGLTLPGYGVAVVQMAGGARRRKNRAVSGK
jgi:beta-galactosidase